MKVLIQRGDIFFVKAHRSYSENVPLQLAKKQYYEKNKEEILNKRKEYNKNN